MRRSCDFRFFRLPNFSVADLVRKKHSFTAAVPHRFFTCFPSLERTIHLYIDHRIESSLKSNNREQTPLHPVFIFRHLRYVSRAIPYQLPLGTSVHTDENRRIVLSLCQTEDKRTIKNSLQRHPVDGIETVRVGFMD